LANAKLSKASPDDADEISAIAIRTYVDAFGDGFPSREELDHHLETTLSVERWRDYLVRDRVFVARIGGTLAGYVQVGPADAAGQVDIRRLYVDRLWQGQGIGTRLLRLAIDHADETGATAIWIDVWEDNSGAQRLYAAHGFVATELRTPFVLSSGEIDGYDTRMVRWRPT
jgi:diamine N-acetyltransferase